MRRARPDVPVREAPGYATLLDYLLGSWRIERHLLDERTGKQGRFTGTARFTPVDGSLRYAEDGVLDWPPHRGPASRALRFEVRAAWSASVFFDDGRLFHTLDLAAGSAVAEHRCGDDRYQGQYRLLGPTAWAQEWRVDGPHKALTILTAYSWEGAGQDASTF